MGEQVESSWNIWSSWSSWNCCVRGAHRGRARATGNDGKRSARFSLCNVHCSDDGSSHCVKTLAKPLAMACDKGDERRCWTTNGNTIWPTTYYNIADGKWMKSKVCVCVSASSRDMVTNMHVVASTSQCGMDEMCSLLRGLWQNWRSAAVADEHPHSGDVYAKFGIGWRTDSLTSILVRQHPATTATAVDTDNLQHGMREHEQICIRT